MPVKRTIVVAVQALHPLYGCFVREAHHGYGEQDFQVARLKKGSHPADFLLQELAEQAEHAEHPDVDFRGVDAPLRLFFE